MLKSNLLKVVAALSCATCATLGNVHGENQTKNSIAAKQALSIALNAMKHNRFSQAEKELRKVLHGDQNNSTALLILPYVLLKLNRPREAADEALKLTVLEPANPDGWISLGGCPATAGKPMQAVQSN
jgi:Tfp pilus assembly protein PilF